MFYFRADPNEPVCSHLYFLIAEVSTAACLVLSALKDTSCPHCPSQRLATFEQSLFDILSMCLLFRYHIDDAFLLHTLNKSCFLFMHPHYSRRNCFVWIFFNLSLCIHSVINTVHTCRIMWAGGRSWVEIAHISRQCVGKTIVTCGVSHHSTLEHSSRVPRSNHIYSLRRASAALCGFTLLLRRGLRLLNTLTCTYIVCAVLLPYDLNICHCHFSHGSRWLARQFEFRAIHHCPHFREKFLDVLQQFGFIDPIESVSPFFFISYGRMALVSCPCHTYQKVAHSYWQDITVGGCTH